MYINEQLRADAEAHVEKNIDMHSIRFRQGREIAQTYVSMMIGYARLDVQSGNFTRKVDSMEVTGFCRIEERHFEHPMLRRTRKRNFWTSQWVETVTLLGQDSDLYDAFLTSLEEFCREQKIRLGNLCALVRTKKDRLECREFPLDLVYPECVEAIGFPYQIVF